MSESSQNSTDFSDTAKVLSSLLSNPDLLSKIGDVIQKHTNTEIRDTPPQSDDFNVDIKNNVDISNINTSNSDYNSPTLENEEKENSNENPLNFLSILSSEKLNFLSFKQEQISLLLAIRPYLSDHRKDLIDGFIKINKIADIFKNLS